jgi:hypothetical protein|tara:strand:+ start:34961 stop:35209 length:249 start_codon:yes stop_codon:yes gene_type:complete
MAVQSVNTTTAWVQVGTTVTRMLFEASGDHYVHLGSTAPAATAPGFFAKSGEWMELLNIDAYGGNVWVRSDVGAGAFTYATA